MSVNQFLPFGMGVGADVLTPAAWSALATRSSGFGTGTALSTQLNTAWRQGATFSSVMGEIILATNQDALFADTVAELKAKLLLALELTLKPRMPPGWYGQFAGAGAPPGRWLRCNGAVVSQTTYAGLFAAIGTTYNTGSEGAGNFRLPDRRGTFDRDLDESRGLDAGRALAAAPQADMLKSHTHELLDSNVEGATPGVQAFGQPGGVVNGLSSFTQATGGTETRPVNMVSRWFISY